MFQMLANTEKTRQHFFKRHVADTTLPVPFSMRGDRRFTVQEYLMEAKEKAPEFTTCVTLSRCIVYRSGLRLARI